MSATLQKIDRKTISRFFSGAPRFILWTEMARRRIAIDVLVSGNPTLAIRKKHQEGPNQGAENENYMVHKLEDKSR